jgi:hypothetical protein
VSVAGSRHARKPRHETRPRRRPSPTFCVKTHGHPADRAPFPAATAELPPARP